MRSLLGLASILVACSPAPPAADDHAPTAKEAPAEPTPDELKAQQRREHGLAEGDWVRLLSGGGACGGETELVIGREGELQSTSRGGCRMGNPDEPPPPPKPRMGTLSPEEVAQLRALLANHALAAIPEDTRSNEGSAHPPTYELFARTDDGILHKQFTWHPARPLAAMLDFCVGTAEARLPPSED